MNSINSIERDVILLLEEIITNPKQTPCKLVINNKHRAYKIPQGEFLRDFPEAVEYVLGWIEYYKKEYGINETKHQLERAPTLYAEITKAGQPYQKRLNEILGVA